MLAPLHRVLGVGYCDFAERGNVIAIPVLNGIGIICRAWIGIGKGDGLSFIDGCGSVSLIVASLTVTAVTLFGAIGRTLKSLLRAVFRDFSS